MLWGQSWKQRHDGVVAEIASIEGELARLTRERDERSVTAIIGSESEAAAARQAIETADAEIAVLQRRLRDLRPTLAHCAAKLAAEQTAAGQRAVRERDRRIGGDPVDSCGNAAGAAGGSAGEAASR